MNFRVRFLLDLFFLKTSETTDFVVVFFKSVSAQIIIYFRFRFAYQILFLYWKTREATRLRLPK